MERMRVRYKGRDLEHIDAGRYRYDPNKHPGEAYSLGLLGLTEEMMAGFWKVSMSAVSQWKDHHPEFMDMLERGKIGADAKVAESLYKRAVGYDYEEDHIAVHKGTVIKTRVTKHVPPDPWSMVKWLVARQRNLWSESHRVEITNTNLNIHKIDLSGVSTEDLMVLKKIGLQALNEHNAETGGQ